MHEIITIYLGHHVIPQLRKEKAQMYNKLMKQFNSMEISNSFQIASFWSNVLANPSVKQATQALK
jgi:hypothetical protein